MSLFRNKEYYEMNEKQFKEMKKFYKKLGYDDKQVKNLCKQCFGAEIKVKEKSYYHENWEFSRNSTGFGPFGAGMPAPGGGRGLGMAMMKAAPMRAKASAPVDSGAVMEDLCAEMPAPMPPMPGAPVPEFNTTKTHVSPEIEESSPLDKPQMMFSANVNNASWSYVRSRILTGRGIDRDFVRIEELVNSYHYKLKKPKDDALFSVSVERGKCPWEDGDELMFVGVKGKKADKKVRQNLAFLVDVSGSMEDRWILVQMSLMSIISKLGKGDLISIIAYSDNTVTVTKQMDCSDLDKCVDEVLKIDGIGGCTNGSEGLTNAYAFLEENYDKEANNRVFIFTDGDFNFGITSEGGLAGFIKKKRETGIYLSVVGYGMNNFKDDNMEALAKNGNGNYTIVTNPADILDNLHDKLISNLVTIAKDVKISVELNPHYVKKYRLIGYDSRVLTRQEFNDTEKAVDGIGSEHNVAALIQFTQDEADQNSGARYVSTQSEGNTDEFAFIEIHYKNPEGENLTFKKVITKDEFENTKDKNIPAAALLAAFGLMVKNSDYKGKADKALLAELLKEFTNIDDDEKDTTSHFAVIKKYIQ